MNVDQLGSFLEDQGFSDEQINDYFEHSGVKGMKWGVRKDRFKQNRALNRAAKAKEHAQEQKDFAKARSTPSTARTHAQRVDEARGKVASGSLRREAKAAKRQYKQDKVEIGSREARKILRSKRGAINRDYAKSREARDGFEVAMQVLSAVGSSMQANARARERQRDRTNADIRIRTAEIDARRRNDQAAYIMRRNSTAYRPPARPMPSGPRAWPMPPVGG